MNPQQPNEYPQAPIGPTPPPQPNEYPAAPVTPQPAMDATAMPTAMPVEPQPVVTPVPPVAPEAPVAPTAPVATPVVPQPQPAPSPASFTPTPQPPVGGGPVGPMPPQAFGTGPAAYPAPASSGPNKKRIGLIVAIVGGLLVIGLGIWLVLTLVTGSIALEKYEGKGYSVLVPKDYTKDEASGTVTFKEPDEDEKTQSQVMVSSYPIKSTLEYTTRDKLIEMYDSTLDEKNMTESGFSSDNKVENFKKEKIKYQGSDARLITFDVTEDGKKVGEGYMLIVFGEDTFYMVMVAAHSGDPALAKSAKKILDSLKIEG